MSFLLIFIFFFLSFSASADCPRWDWDETVVLKKINDGDTVTLKSGRLVRFIGINTPEINHRHLKQSAPYALEAKSLLKRYIRAGDKIHLIYDKTKQDKYGRRLAYVYSKSGRDLGLLQLKAGLAQHLVIGKNDKFWRCYQAAQRHAKLRKKGIWSDFKPLSAKRLNKNNKGYVYIKGRVTSVNKSQKGLQLELDKRLLVWISQSKLKSFTDNHIDLSLHSKLLLTGKLFFSHDQAKLTLYHPSQILP